MNKGEILTHLEATHIELNGRIHEMSEHDISLSIDSKWSAIDHVVHLSKVLFPLEKALRKPKFLLRYSFGKPNRPGRDYNQVKERYYEKLAKIPSGITSAFIPKDGDDLRKEIVLARFKANQEKLTKTLKRWTDSQLNKHLLPHPLLGKVTVKEMLYFIDFHTQHHMEIMNKIER